MKKTARRIDRARELLTASWQYGLLNKVKSTINRHSMLSGGETILVGFSGGPDSVCLLHVLHELKNEFRLKLNSVYIDHGLRPDETPDEIEFCRKMCDELEVPFFSRSIDVKSYAKEHGLSKQDAARQLRYAVFNEISFGIKTDRIALGHNADDQIETFFMRTFRGSGPKGLSGIPPVRKNIIRPLIEIERNEIEAFFDGKKTGYIVDSSNFREDYLRNKIRISFMPEVKKINPDIAETLSRTMEILREEEKYFSILVTKALMRIISRKTDKRIELFLVPLESMEKIILRRVLRRALDETSGLREVGFGHIESIIELINKGRHGDRLYLPKGVRVIKDYSLLVITSEVPLKINAYTLEVPGEVILNEAKTVVNASIVEISDDYGDGKTAIVLDADKTGNILHVRSREKGDYFYPTGFGKKKKLQDFFVDEKVPRDERDIMPIITSGDDIVWIAGCRGDERFKVNNESKRFLRLNVSKLK